MKHRWFYEETYQVHIHLVWNATPERIEKFFDRKFNVDYGNKEFQGRCIDMDKDGIAIVIPRWRRNAKGISILCHEAFHAVEYIFKNRDIKFRPATSEVAAYLLDSLVFRCLNVLNK